MDEKSIIEAQIAGLERKIAQKKRGEPYPSPAPYARTQPYATRPPGRWATRGRGGRAGYHQSRSSYVWRAGGTQTPPLSEPVASSDADEPVTPPAGTNPRNGYTIPPPSAGKMELMSKDTYERQQKQQQQERQQARATDTPPNPTPRTPGPSTTLKDNQSVRQITVEGMTFQISDDGSKLLRISDFRNIAQATPKKASIAGVDFHRTKHGNLMRAPTQRDSTRFNSAAPKAQCETFTRQGSCPFGPKCRFTHDPEKIAICKGFLLNGKCPAGDDCDLSHEMSYHRVSACTHFLRGNCTNDACRYPHVDISPSASVCREFAALGYCAVGERCSRRHVFECPDYANRGACTNQKCQLPHVDRASTLRKAAKRQAKMMSGSENDSDLSSDDGSGSDGQSEFDDIDADDKGVNMTGSDDDHALTQQQDYVSLS